METQSAKALQPMQTMLPPMEVVLAASEEKVEPMEVEGTCCT